MNWASARCRRAIAPFSTTKRAPESLPAGLEVEAGAGGGDFEVLERVMGEVARGAPAADFDVGGLVRAVRDVVHR